MRTTVTLDSSLVGELLKHSRAKTKTAAVTEAVREHVRRVKLEKLSGLLGRVNFLTESVAAGEAADAERDEFLGGLADAEPDAE